ncbi:ABC transporter permease [Facklamia miroungae]|uniref:ABC-type polysaccharide/polyol phosphate export permease n=1 Tax=Facklamia miroungae TaxID=120956 RepID=A0A1G7RRW5_9LACT|nr:ABC transporter permease [Facklamia miroungae]NKZ29303.1 ABC transporter permease [Facklamia miroungae]SDG13443.1 ABC-type polysaccharide/polyol phosphate export permease [Facklamia miroungae]
MKKFLNYFTNNLRLYLKALPVQLALYVLLPITISLFMAWSMAGVSEADSKDLDIDIRVENKDQGDYGKLLLETFKSNSLSQYFNLKEDASIMITVPRGFSESVNKMPLQITVKGDPRMSEVEVVKSIVGQWHQTILENIHLTQASQALSQDQQQTFKQQIQKLNTIDLNDFVHKKAVSQAKHLNAVETYLISGLIYSLIIGLNSATSLATKDELSGLVKRLNIIPLTTGEKTTFEWLSDSLVMVINTCLILALMRFHPDVDGRHLIQCIPWLFLYAGFFQAIGMFLVSSLPKLGIQVMIQFIAMFFIFTGLIPLGDLMGGAVQELLSKNWMQIYIINPLRFTLLGESIPNASRIIATLVGLIIILLSITYLRRQRKEQGF